MFNRHWQWLMVAFCSSIGIACSHSKCSQCTTCTKGCATAPVVAVKPCPCGSSKTYVMIPNAPCNTCAKAPVAAAPANVAAAPPTPRVLDPKVAEAKPVEQPAPPPRGVAKVEDAAKAHRDPASGLIRFDHARDYAWVVGQLQYLHGKRQWRVRYSPFDVDDTFGGVVTITGLDHLAEQFKDGATVRIQGQLVDPDSHKPSPEYYVYDIKVLE